MSPPRNHIRRAVLARSTGLTHDGRVLAVRVLDLTEDLVAHAARHEWQPVARLLLERRILVDRIPEDPPWSEVHGCTAALRAAMEESDRAVALLLARATLDWPGCKHEDASPCTRA